MPNKKIFEKIAAIFWWLPFSTAFDTPRRRRNPLHLRPPRAPGTRTHGAGGARVDAAARVGGGAEIDMRTVAKLLPRARASG